ncbi:MAG: ABC transporter ATP-binding protein [Dongiaceae bacterium]
MTRPDRDGPEPAATAAPILQVRDLSIEYRTPRGRVRALQRVDLEVPEGEIVGIVGESGCGKTTLISAINRLLPANAVVTGGSVLYRGEDVLRMSASELRRLRGSQVAMVFQDPMTSLNPVLTIGRQMTDIQHREPSPAAAKRRRAAAMLRRVGIPDPEQRLDTYPHQFSGGMRQRVAIAMALLMNPGLLVADEPTTALDVTLEAQIVHLLRELRRELRGSILFISHTLGLIAQLCDRVVVMYAGTVVERAPVRELFHRPGHPYTRALLQCDPARIDVGGVDLPTIPGEIPDLVAASPGCLFAPRCPRALDRCRIETPELRSLAPAHDAACLRLDDAPAA